MFTERNHLATVAFDIGEDQLHLLQRRIGQLSTLFGRSGGFCRRKGQNLTRRRNLLNRPGQIADDPRNLFDHLGLGFGAAADLFDRPCDLMGGCGHLLGRSAQPLGRLINAHGRRTNLTHHLA